MSRKRVLFFDSGVGGLSVVQAALAAGYAADFDYLADNAWLPYGDKPDAALKARVPALLAAAQAAWAPDAIVMACNTASTVALEAARARLGVPIIGVVPPIKPAAAMTQTGVIGLLATPGTIARPYIDDLIARFAPGVQVVRYGSTALVAIAEARLAGRGLDQAGVAREVAAMRALPGAEAMDVAALGCTHFPLLVDVLSVAFGPGVRLLESGPAVARRLGEAAGLEAGAPRLRRAALTAPGAWAQLGPAFQALGFQTTAQLTPQGELLPWEGAQNA